ncbi:hypothetical protein [Halopelagius fulvigenes]|uniref:Uncharacterized protein n=1 Tax=Halopelagius fulvigenes TaxID=1198324 RepID=A0ABD5TYR1_9EURY
MTDEELRSEVNQLKSDFQGLLKQHQTALQRIDELEDRVEDLEAENDALRRGADLVQTVRKNGATTTEKRAVEVINTLGRRAGGRPDSQPARSELDATGIVNALGGSIDRTNTYGFMDDVVELVGNPNVLWKQKEPRSSSDNTRLVLDLRNGDLPEMVAGHELEVTTA